jgi:hypothetical protein
MMLKDWNNYIILPPELNPFLKLYHSITHPPIHSFPLG